MAEKKKILYIVEAMGGGVFTYIVDLANQEPLLLSRQGHGSEDQLCGREPIRGHTEKMRTDASEIKKKKAEENLHFSTLKR